MQKFAHPPEARDGKQLASLALTMAQVFNQRPSAALRNLALGSAAGCIHRRPSLLKQGVPEFCPCGLSENAVVHDPDFGIAARNV